MKSVVKFFSLHMRSRQFTDNLPEAPGNKTLVTVQVAMM